MVGVGRVDHADLVRRAEETFGTTRASPRERPEPAVYKGGDRREERALEQAHVTLGFNGLAFDDPDYYAFQVYSTVLGGGMSSRLFQEVREVRGQIGRAHV